MEKQRGRMVQSVEGSEEWAWAVTQAVGSKIVTAPWIWAGPVFVRATFWMPVPDVTVQRTGDLDKLLRNVLDAMTKAGAYGDDVQVTRVETQKCAVLLGEAPGVLLQFERDEWDVARWAGLAYARWEAMRGQGLA